MSLSGPCVFATKGATPRQKMPSCFYGGLRQCVHSLHCSMPLALCAHQAHLLSSQYAMLAGRCHSARISGCSDATARHCRLTQARRRVRAATPLLKGTVETAPAQKRLGENQAGSLRVECMGKSTFSNLDDFVLTFGRLECALCNAVREEASFALPIAVDSAVVAVQALLRKSDAHDR